MTRILLIVLFGVVAALSSLAAGADRPFPALLNLGLTDADITIHGLEPGAWTGYAMATGDFDGDTLPDIVITSHGTDHPQGEWLGEIEVVWGWQLQAASDIHLSDLSGTSRIVGGTPGGTLYWSLASGDVNGDGIDDILIGKPMSGAATFDGMAFVVLGSASFPDTVNLVTDSTGVITITDGPRRAWLGADVCACDMNGDEFDDIVVSAPAQEYGEVFVIAGGDSLETHYALASAPAGLTRIVDDIDNQRTGRALGCADVDNDGYGDLVIGSPGRITGRYHGVVTVLYGSANMPDTLWLGDPTFLKKRVQGEYTHGFLGRQVASGDVDHNGAVDLVVSAEAGDALGVWNCGEVYILYDADSLPDSLVVDSPTHPMTRLIGSRQDANYGRGLVCDDFSGDGFADVAFACRSIDFQTSTRDTVAVFYGSALRPESVFVASDTSLTRIVSDNHDDSLGRAMASADYNQDGFCDLALGAFSYPDNTGRAYVIFALPSSTAVNGPVPQPFVLRQNQPNPFARSTHIPFQLGDGESTSIMIYNVRGQVVREIAVSPAQSSVTWDGRDSRGRFVASGVYFYSLRVRGDAQTRKMTLVR